MGRSCRRPGRAHRETTAVIRPTWLEWQARSAAMQQARKDFAPGYGALNCDAGREMNGTGLTSLVSFNHPFNMEETPTVLMLAGLPGTGKTRLAYELGRIFGWTVLDKDIFNAQLLNAGLPQSQAGPLAYELLFSLARDLVIKQRHSVILDTAGRQPRILEQATLIAKDAGARLQVVRLIASHAIRRKRMASRIPGPSQWVTDDTTDEEEAQWYAHIPAEAFVISTDQPVERVLASVVTFLRGGASAP
jgi:predicted kinase